MQDNYDVIIIGGGTAGANAARTAKDSGAGRVALIRNPDMPNTCIRQGCMPGKALLSMAAKGLPFAEAMVHKRKIIKEFEVDLKERLEAEDYDLLEGMAAFTGDKTIRLEGPDGERELSAERFIVATGASGFVPPIEGLDDLEKTQCFTSDDVVSLQSVLEEPPKRLLVLGAGPIGLEMATFFHRMNTDVVVIEMLDQILPLMDPEFGELRLKTSRAEGEFPIHINSKLTRTEKTDEGVRATVEDKDGEETAYEVDAILVATGRKPNLDNLGLDNVGCVVGDKHLEHDEHTLQTKNPDIYLAGDASGHHQILHIAAKMGQVAGHNAAVGKPEKRMDYDAVNMAVIFEEHPSAIIGLTGKRAEELGHRVVSATRDLSDFGRGITDAVDYGLMKLVADADTGCILGAQMLGPHAGETIHALSAVISLQGTTSDMVGMTWYHPTYSELWHSMANEICENDRTVCFGA